MTDALLIICGIFYSVLCVFSIVTGGMYALGKKELNPLELSDRFMEKYKDPEKLKDFTVKMGLVTVVVGIAQGITAFSLIRPAIRSSIGSQWDSPCFLLSPSFASLSASGASSRSSNVSHMFWSSRCCFSAV